MRRTNAADLGGHQQRDLVIWGADATDDGQRDVGLRNEWWTHAAGRRCAENRESELEWRAP